MATDLGMGQPMEQALRSCLISLQLARRLGCSEDTLADVYYLALVEHIGCSADAYEVAVTVGGDDLAARRLGATLLSDPPSDRLRMLTHLAAGRPVPERARLLVGLLASGQQGAATNAAARCEAGVLFANRLDLSPGVRDGLAYECARWDGKGIERAAGEAIPLIARIVLVGHDVEIFERLGGMGAAKEAVRRRRGKAFDPMVADVFLKDGEECTPNISSGTLWELALDAEPGPHRTIAESAIDGAAQALADFADLKSPSLHGHSTGVSQLAEQAARAMGCADPIRGDLRRAGLVHDLGRIGVPTGIWEKPGGLTSAEFERVRLHPYYTERVLARASALGSMLSLAGCHHERLNGSGYHRGTLAAQLSMPSRLLQAADVYQALVQPRAHRPALGRDGAARELAVEVACGRIDRQAANAVLEAAGQRPLKDRREWPAGLTDREVDVLRLVCQGKISRQIAQALHISEKTVSHHIEHIYGKIERSTRAGAVLFAMEHDLIAGA